MPGIANSTSWFFELGSRRTVGHRGYRKQRSALQRPSTVSQGAVISQRETMLLTSAPSRQARLLPPMRAVVQVRSDLRAPGQPNVAHEPRREHRPSRRRDSIAAANPPYMVRASKAAAIYRTSAKCLIQFVGGVARAAPIARAGGRRSTGSDRPTSIIGAASATPPTIVLPATAPITSWCKLLQETKA